MNLHYIILSIIRLIKHIRRQQMISHILTQMTRALSRMQKIFIVILHNLTNTLSMISALVSHTFKNTFSLNIVNAQKLTITTKTTFAH